MVNIVVICLTLLIVWNVIIAFARGMLHTRHNTYLMKSISKIKEFKEDGNNCIDQTKTIDASLNEDNMIFSTGIINRQLAVFEFDETGIMIYYMDVDNLGKTKDNCVRYTYEQFNRKKCFMHVSNFMSKYNSYIHIEFNGDDKRYVYCSDTKGRDVLLDKFIKCSKLEPNVYINEMIMDLIPFL